MLTWAHFGPFSLHKLVNHLPINPFSLPQMKILIAKWLLLRKEMINAKKASF